MIDLFTDGGLLSRNPSRLGGTWAWVAVEDGVRLRHDSGTVFCMKGLPQVTNNQTEFVAALKGLEAMSDGWDGTLYTDSRVTYDRIRRGHAPNLFNTRRRFADAVKRLGGFQVALIAGHPSKDDLLRGCKENGTPVSAHNAFVDDLCSKRAYEARVGRRPAAHCSWLDVECDRAIASDDAPDGTRVDLLGINV
jgi:ribonuclease HI